MKHFLIFLIVMSLLIAAGAVAQTNEGSNTSKEKDETKQAVEKPTATVHPEVSKVPRVYPIAPGVWYPGQALPEKPFRYYRIRCWPGCHHASPYGMYPDEPVPGESKTAPQESEPQTTPTPLNETSEDRS